MTAAENLLARIRAEGRIDGSVIKVDRFLNHQVDPQLMTLLGCDLAARFAATQPDKILTAETSGIMIAQAVALELGIPFVFAKKKRPITMAEYYSAESYSFTKQETTTLYVSREVLGAGERVLIIDDFYAKGATHQALTEIIAAAGAELIGSGVIINKSQRRDVEAVLRLEEIDPSR